MEIARRNVAQLYYCATGFEKHISKQPKKRFLNSALISFYDKIRKLLCQQTAAERSGASLNRFIIDNLKCATPLVLMIAYPMPRRAGAVTGHSGGVTGPQKYAVVFPREDGDSNDLSNKRGFFAGL